MELLWRYPTELFGIGLMLLLSAFYSAAETALFSLTREQLRRFESAPTSTHRAIVALMAQPQALLAVLLFVNMVANIFYFSMSYFLAARVGSESGAAGTAVGAAAFLLAVVAGEVIPKGIAVGRPSAVAHMAALPMLLHMRAMGPARRILAWITDRTIAWFKPKPADQAAITAEELRLLLDFSARQGVIGRDASRMMREVMVFGEVTLKEIMLPRVDISAFDLADSRAEFVNLIRRARHAHITVYEGTIDNVVGVVASREVLLHPERPIREAARPVFFVPETKTVESMLRDFRERREKIAIVVDEYGGTSGLVTLEYIVEQIVGEITDENEPRPGPVRPLGDNAFLVEADLGIRDWADFFPVVLESPRMDTVGGFFISLCERWPRPGDSVEYRGLRLTAVKMQGLRLEQIRVESALEAAGAKSAGGGDV